MDDDLKKTSHDDIIKWVHDNADHLFEKLIYQKEYSEDEIQYIKEKTTNVLLNTYHKPKDKIIRHNQLGKIPEYSKLTTDDIKFSDQIPKKSKVEVVNHTMGVYD
ncbi:MAG: hypothetical protein U5K27_04750 [Desulfotignum sp.]|nr:hypothetical protein [Desulfotignum sp.]